MGECGLFGALGIYHRMSTVFSPKLMWNTGCSAVAHNTQVDFIPHHQPAHCKKEGRSLHCCLATERDVPLLLIVLLRNWEKCCSHLQCLQSGKE